MNEVDIAFSALTAWRENRGGGIEGMQSVLNVIWNRTQKRKLSPYEVCVQRLQFSSMTFHNDPQLAVYPSLGDSEFAKALEMARDMCAGKLEDITGGADFYFAKSIPAPDWATAYIQTAEIKDQLFYRS